MAKISKAAGPTVAPIVTKPKGKRPPAPSVPETGNDAQDATPYPELTNDQLREKLEARELPTSGNKTELVERLQEDDAKE